MEQRFPTPLRQDVVGAGHARSASTRPIVYGLIRQESRFIMDARSGVGASRPDAADAGHRALDGEEDRPALLAVADHRPRHQPAPRHRLPEAGARRLRRLAGDGRRGLQRRARPAAQWREGPVLEPAVWAENIPFTETRDYVKKVLQQRRPTTRRCSAGTAPLAARPASAATDRRRADGRAHRRRAAGPAASTRRESPFADRACLAPVMAQRPGPRRHRLRRPQRLRKAGRALRRRRRPHPRADPAPGPRQAPAAAADGRGRRSATSTTTTTLARMLRGADAVINLVGDPARQRSRVRARPRAAAGRLRARPASAPACSASSTSARSAPPPTRRAATCAPRRAAKRR